MSIMLADADTAGRRNIMNMTHQPPRAVNATAPEVSQAPSLMPPRLHFRLGGNYSPGHT